MLRRPCRRFRTRYYPRRPEREIALVIDESPPRQWNIAEAAAKIETALSTPIHLVGTDRNGVLLRPWIISAEQIRAALEVTLRAAGEGRRYEVGLDLSALERYLATLSPPLSKPASRRALRL